MLIWANGGPAGKNNFMTVEDLVNFSKLKGVRITIDPVSFPLQNRIIMDKRVNGKIKVFEQVVPTDHIELPLLSFMAQKLDETSG